MSPELRVVTFTVPGKPEPKGSTRIVPVRGRAVITSDNAKLKAWQCAIEWRAMTLRAPLFTGPVTVALRFALKPPKRRRRQDTHPQRKPDVDKLARAVLDALTGQLLRDDAQVVALHACKVYADAGDGPGVVITVAEIGGAS